MKIRLAVTLSQELVKAIDEHIRERGKTRSAFVEGAVRAFVGRWTRREQNARDLEIINDCADFLNHEALDVLEYL